MGNFTPIDKSLSSLREASECGCGAACILLAKECANWPCGNSANRGNISPSEKNCGVRGGPLLAGLVGIEILEFGQEFTTKISQVLGSLKSETLLQLLIDDAGRYVTDRVICQGGISEARGSFRTLIETSIFSCCERFVLAHNHPSGSLEPSQSDIRFTHHLKALCAPLEIELEDHLVVTDWAVLSMRKAGLL